MCSHNKDTLFDCNNYLEDAENGYKETVPEEGFIEFFGDIYYGYEEVFRRLSGGE